MNEIILLQSAQADLLEIIALHGETSYHLIDKDLELIRKMPGIAPLYDGFFRRRVVPRSPFGLFYRVEGARVMVSFVLDLRQDPAAIERRLRR